MTVETNSASGTDTPPARFGQLPRRRAAVLAHRLAVAVAIVVGVLLARHAPGQKRSPQSYSDYFNRKISRNPTASPSPRKYMFQKYLWDNPAVSPYLQLMRPSARGSSYQRYVAPALARQEKTMAAAEVGQQNKQRRHAGNRGNVPASLYGNQGRSGVSNYHQLQYGRHGRHGRR